MSGLTDKESWRRAWGPALRVFGYITAIYVVIYLLIIAPAYILVSGLGFPEVLNEIAGLLAVLGFVFAVPLSFFKVQDEMQPGEIPLQMSK